MRQFTWTPGERELSARIASHSFEAEGQTLTFVGRLARDHGWEIDFARALIEDYRRFCFLAVTGRDPVTPSEEVDEVWHLHLTFSRDYWDVWCRDVLRAPLHHQPTTGGPAEAARFATQYARTLARHEAYFGPPPLLHWPGTARRFGRRARFRTVDRQRAVVIPIPAVLRSGPRGLLKLIGLSALLSSVAAGPTDAMTADVLDWTAGPFLTLYVVMAFLALMAALAFDAIIRRRGEGDERADELSAVELALLSGGPARAADVLALNLVQAGHVAIRSDRTLLAGAAEKAERPPQLAALLDHGPGLPRSSLVGLMEPWIESAWHGLARKGLALSRADTARIGMVTMWLVVPVVMLGFFKIIVGASRDKAIGILAVLVVVTLLAGLGIARRRSPATACGRQMLSGFAERHARAVRAPLPKETTLAFAVVGAAALAGTDLAGYAGVHQGGWRRPWSGNWSGWGCGGGGCSSCGGD